MWKNNKERRLGWVTRAIAKLLFWVHLLSHHNLNVRNLVLLGQWGIYLLLCSSVQFALLTHIS